jgi:tol-pal system protein YbgF
VLYQKFIILFSTSKPILFKDLKMKFPYLLLLTLSTGSAYAAPLLDNGSYDYQPVTTYSTPTTPVSMPSITASSGVSDYELSNTLNQLKSDVATLKTKIDGQAKTLADLKQRQETINVSVNNRLNSLTNTAATPPVSPLAKVVYSQPVAQNVTAIADEKSHYEAAYATFRSGNYPLAIAQMQALQATYPKGEYADNALYWMGESYLKLGDKNNAAQAFDLVVRNYPKGGKVPDALVKQGMTQLSLNNKAKAKEYFDYVITAYPGSSAAGIALTKRAQAGIY